VSNTASTTVARIATVLAGVSGLSTERVRRGDPTGSGVEGSPPLAWLRVAGIDSSYGPDLGAMTRTVQVQVVIRAGSESDEYGTREDAVLDLLDACLAAIEADTTLRGLLRVPPRTVTSGLIDGTGTGPATAAFAIECIYFADLGEGI